MSQTYQPKVYLIRTLTNLHVGGGDGNFDYVDKQVQRDSASKYPTIYASGIKGSLRDYMKAQGFAGITTVFGSEPGDPTSVQGAYRFVSADILALPRPSVGLDATSPYEIVSTEHLVQHFQQKVQAMGGTAPTLSFQHTPIETPAFRELAATLPVLARNHLESGVSQNLWYEEVVPRESYFGFTILVPEGHEHFDDFNALLQDKVIQLGANATIGYGLCHFTQL